MKKYTSIFTLFIVTAFMVSCGNKDNTLATANTPVIIVKTSQVETNNTSPFLAVSGKIQAANSADLSTRLMGYVTKVHSNVGEKVKQGQLLVSINNTDLQAKRAQVKAGILTQDEFNQIEAENQILFPVMKRMWHSPPINDDES